jgi:hypothetical protein
MRIYVVFPFLAAVLLVACAPTEGGDTTLNVSQILIGSQVNERNEIEVNKNQFIPSERTFHAHVFIAGLEESTEIVGSWWYVPKQQKIFETTVSVAPEFPVAKFVLQNSQQDWASGTYEFVVQSGDTRLSNREILVFDEE